MNTMFAKNLSLVYALIILTLSSFAQCSCQSGNSSNQGVYTTSSNSGVYVNGYELPAHEAQALQQFAGKLDPGQYYFDQNGNFGKKGEAPMFNLLQMYNQMVASQNPYQNYNNQNYNVNQQYNQQGNWQQHPDGDSYRRVPGTVNGFEYSNGQRKEYINPLRQTRINGSSIMMGGKVLSYPTGVNIN